MGGRVQYHHLPLEGDMAPQEWIFQVLAKELFIACIHVKLLYLDLNQILTQTETFNAVKLQFGIWLIFKKP